MTNRANLSPLWAADGVVTDPDLDTTHPIYEANKYSLGWDYNVVVATENKHPSPWRNFMLQKSLARPLYIAEAGVGEWHPDTSYALGAVCRGSDGRFYVANSASTGTDPVGASTTVWEQDALLNYTKVEYGAMLQAVRDDYSAHIVRIDNPHTVLAGQFYNGVGYDFDEVNALLDTVNEGVEDHIDLLNNPHSVTLAQINCLPVTGGDFTGQVNLVAGWWSGDYSVAWSSNGLAIQVSHLTGPGVDVDGNAFIGDGVSRTGLFHDGNYVDLQMDSRRETALPLPLFHLPLNDSLSSTSSDATTVSFSRPSSITFTSKSGVSTTLPADEDGYDAQGMVWTSDTYMICSLTLTGPVSLVWVADGEIFVQDRTGDSPTAWGGSVSDAVNASSPTATRIRNFRAYPQLTPRTNSYVGLGGTMTTRLDVSRIWASTNADVSNTDPGTTKYLQGWIAEIPPFQYMNFLQNRIDTNIRALAERGVFEWGSDVDYDLGALAWDEVDGKVYKASVASPSTSLSPSVNLSQWDESIAQQSVGDINTLQADIDQHEANTSNPHSVTAAQANTYTAAQIDQLFNQNSADLSAHVADLANPHEVNAAQVGAVPITGGTYTGVVDFQAAVTELNKGAAGGTKLIDASDGMFISSGNYALGVNATGASVYKIGAVEYPLMSYSDYQQLRLDTGEDYSVPEPDFSMPLVSDINIYRGFGTSSYSAPSGRSYTDKTGTTQVAGTDEPAFSLEGLVGYDTGTSLSVDITDNLTGFGDFTVHCERQEAASYLLEITGQLGIGTSPLVLWHHCQHTYQCYKVYHN